MIWSESECSAIALSELHAFEFTSSLCYQDNLAVSWEIGVKVMSGKLKNPYWVLLQECICKMEESLQEFV